MTGKLIAVNKINILATPSAVKINLAFKLKIQSASKLAAPLNAILNASAMVTALDAIAT